MALRITKIIFITSLILLAGCYYDNEEELYGPLQQLQQCDTTQPVSYSNFVAPLIQNRCLMCHGNAMHTTSGGNINLDGYANISNYLTNNKARFLGAIKWQAGFSPMPKGGTKLDDCSILKIEKWINNGFPNN